MSQDPKVPTRTGAVIAAAAGALTLAAGVTVGALLGWVGPPRTTTPDAPPVEATQRDPQPSAPAIVDDESTVVARERPRRRERDHHEEKRRHHHEERDHDD